MNKYTELSDLEINKRVFVAAKIEHEDTDLHGNKVFYGDGAKWIEFDPCNNPSDAMPIIIENKIAIFPMNALGVKYWCAASEFKDIGEKEIVWGLESNNQNPLRAAMELFLMLKDAENENNNKR
ncbi:phage protein NinX family protein [Proteus terrae]|uniref:phage protein NinX family protein n=1 Tax=Proteus terrae TaxID=1574161 RepID=UPI00298C0865|nr:phage protein NinX family protein [Proteus terrae]WPD00624.1 phage protein NinX family protein [Proteus terrae]